MSLLQKRKFNDQPKMANCSNPQNKSSNENILYCLQMVSVVSITFGNPILDNYFEGVKSVIGAKRAENVFKQLKQRYEQHLKQFNQDKQDEDNLNMNILKQINQMLGDRINKSIQKRVKLFQQCIDSCMQLALLPQAAQQLINNLRGFESEEQIDEQESSSQKNSTSESSKINELIDNIKSFIGEEQFIQLIQHSLRKLNVSRSITLSSVATAKCRAGDMCDEITTSSTLSDENSAITTTRLQIEENKDNIQKLPYTLKQTILSKIIPCLTKLQENINHITIFESVCA